MEDGELRRRLARFNYPCPPITESTRGVLVKKLAQLEGSAGGDRASNGAKRKTQNGRGKAG